VKRTQSVRLTAQSKARVWRTVGELWLRKALGKNERTEYLVGWRFPNENGRRVGGMILETKGKAANERRERRRHRTSEVSRQTKRNVDAKTQLIP